MTPALAAINHLLAQEAWARDALALHAGKQACIDTGHLQLAARVTHDGMLEPGGLEDTASVTIHVKLGDLPLIAQNRERAFSYVKIEGDAEFANAISQLAKGLRWEAAHDLERVVGPLAAQRLATGARDALAALTGSGRKLAGSVAEYLLEERAVLARPALVDGFADEVSRLRDDAERLDKRIARLARKLAPATTGREQK